MNFPLYLLKRLLLMIPTFLGISILSFGIIQMAPGGPVENYIAKMKFSGGAESAGGDRGQGVSADVIKELEQHYGFDKPLHVRYLSWLKQIFTFDFGYSYTYGKPVIDVIASKFPVSVQFGILTFILTYLICIPLGIIKALRDGSAFDVASSFVIFLLYSIPGLMMGIILIVLFSGGRYWDIFPLGGIESIDAGSLGTWDYFKDRVWHAVLPLTCMVLTDLASLTLLMKNSIVEEIGKDYIRTAQAKGLKWRKVISKHALRNSLIPIVTGMGGFLAIFFTSNLLLEKIFNLDGFGRLFYDAALQRDYPVLMAQVVIGAMIALIGQLTTDILYLIVDPRIDFN